MSEVYSKSKLKELLAVSTLIVNPAPTTNGKFNSGLYFVPKDDKYFVMICIEDIEAVFFEQLTKEEAFKFATKVFSEQDESLAIAFHNQFVYLTDYRKSREALALKKKLLNFEVIDIARDSEVNLCNMLEEISKNQ